MERETFGSRLGFILVSAGCAIGIGNVWRFPYVAGQNGGGIFVVFYLLFLVLMGIPILSMELAVGRAGKGTAVKAYKALEPKGTKWHIQGIFGLIGSYILMMYYTTVSGWMLSYFFKFVNGSIFENAENLAVSDNIAEKFNSMLSSAPEMTIWMCIIVIAGFFVLSMGLKNGLERVSKVMMLALLALIGVLAVRSILLPGASEGLKFYLLPDIKSVSEQGIFNVISAAMNQSFFTLSLGIGAMEILGSYMSRDNSIGGEAVRICILDTIVALFSGLIIFPACFSYNIAPDQGPSLIFVTLPNIFSSMSGGRIWGALFFLFMTFASFSTVIAVLENISASCVENFGWSRKKSLLLNMIIIIVASIPCILGFNLWKNFAIAGKNVLDIEDFAVSNLLLPIGALIYLLFCVTKYGWNFDNYLTEANSGKGIKFPKGNVFKWYLRLVLPILIIVIIIQGLI